MRNTYKNLALLAGVLVAGGASAQNTVTLYGVVDTGLMYVYHSAGQTNQFLMSTGILSGSRWGLKGSEDLGGGLSTVFQLENGFDSSSGNFFQGGRQFGRQAYVGLSGKDTWGTVTFGRQYDPLIDKVQPLQGDNWLAGFSQCDWTRKDWVRRSKNWRPAHGNGSRWLATLKCQRGSASRIMRWRHIFIESRRKR